MIRAAFIGIDRYADSRISDLNGAVRDATALWAVLSDTLQDMSGALITDQAATLEALNAILDATLGEAGPDDVVLISFAGHGTPDHRLVVADTDTSDLFATTFCMENLADRFRRTRARAVLMLLDCCFSGGATARVLDIGVAPRAIGIPLVDVAGQGRILFAASAPDQPALEDHHTRHGLFTKAVLDCLLQDGDPISVVGMVDDVVKAVRAAAASYGYEQTPVMFGHVEGELSLPACRRGANFYAAFPERAPIRTTGQFVELAGYGIPDEVLQAWQRRYPAGLNQLQIAAVNEHNVLGGNSLLTVAPTSAGKTFVGEMAAIKAVAEGRKAVFLLPYKALVNEKFEDFTAIYQDQLHLRVARCSGDWQDQVGDVMRGKYDLAFFTYEKFLALMMAAPHILNQIGLVVLDEAQFITEQGRGMVVELLLTNLIAARRRGVAPQLVALSAVIGHINGFDRWLDCGLLLTTERPVPLIEGVIDRTGTWQFRSPAGEVYTAQLLDRVAIRQRGDKHSSQDVIVPLVRHLVGLGEKVIVFRNSRGAASGCAKYLARELGLPAAGDVIAALPQGDPSVMSANLREALAGGVAFHSSDLNREERQAVERGFRHGEGGVKVLVATSTVAAGVNTPASTVVIVETGFPSGGGDTTPYAVAQYKNMAGRAGRLGYEAQGKAIVIAETVMERSRLFRTYVQGHPEAISSSFDEHRPGTWVVRLLAQVKEVPRSLVIGLVSDTYGGYLGLLRDPRWRDAMEQQLEGILDRMVADGLVEQADDGMLHLTMLGRACGESPMTLESALRLVEVIRQLSPEDASPESLLVLIELLQERDDDYTPQTRQGESRWQQEAANRFGYDMASTLRRGARADRTYYARCKRALIVNDWINGVPVTEIEEGYSANTFSRVGHGDIRGYVDGSRYLLESVVRIASIVLERPTDEERVEALFRRLDLGIPEAMLPMTQLKLELTRSELLTLWREGMVSPEQVAVAAPADLERLVRGKGMKLHQLAVVSVPKVA
ncbi:peptidase C14 [alpha proteobacterium AAP38]|nr:peptidase C14 [alpha proteobacterium AAP38]